MIGIIGGTGLDSLPGAKINRRHNFTSKYGPTSDAVLEVEVDEQTFLFLPRHAADHCLPPHLINYRANIWALHKLGVSEIVAVNAVGGIHPDYEMGDLAVPHQIIDYTYGRESTFCDGVSEPLQHCDFSEPFSESLRQKILASVIDSPRVLHREGVYACTQGPRLETAAEIQKLGQDGCDLVGMTAMPEAALARELGISYAAIAMVVNPAAGLSETPLSQDAIAAESKRMAEDVYKILRNLVCFDQESEDFLSI